MIDPQPKFQVEIWNLSQQAGHQGGNAMMHVWLSTHVNPKLNSSSPPNVSKQTHSDPED